jgi:hypothetical protein
MQIYFQLFLIIYSLGYTCYNSVRQILTGITMQPNNMTFDSLVNSLMAYNQRQNEVEFTSFIPQFISMAENRLSSVFKNLGQLRYVGTDTVTSTIAKPENWRCTRSFRVKNVLTGETRTMLERSYEFIKQYDAEAIQESPLELPRYYGDYDFYNWELTFINPTLVSNLHLEVGYYERPPYLSEVNQQNWWTQYSPQCILYSAMLEAALYLRTPENIQYWGQLLQQSVSEVSKEDANRIVDWSFMLKGATE